jgi:NAD-dependent deacetylase
MAGMFQMKQEIDKAADIVIDSNLTIALTGAGISVESGIPDFRSSEGLWARYDPAEYAEIEAFRTNPEKVWKMLLEMNGLVEGAKPNKAHLGMGKLEEMGYLNCVITQNIDNLHQAGGSKNVIEYHGNSSTLSCLWCGAKYVSQEKKNEHPPKCQCGKILKPDIIFFGEAIPMGALTRSFDLAAKAQAVLVVGTSASVSPANTIPSTAKENGAFVIEINMERTHLTGRITDVFLQGPASEMISALLETVEQKTA